MALCMTCYGIGECLVDENRQPVTRLRDGWSFAPCPDCGGCGRVHCCEGEITQPEPAELGRDFDDRLPYPDAWNTSPTDPEKP